MKKVLLVLIFLTGCSRDEDSCKDVYRGDLDYCNCYYIKCKPSQFKPKE